MVLIVSFNVALYSFLKSKLMIIRNFVWQNVGDRKCSSEGKGPQKTGGQGRSEGKGSHTFWIGPCPHVLVWASPWAKCDLEDTTACH